MARSIRTGGLPFVEQLAAVAFDALLDRKERRGETRAAQRADVRLSEILVLAFQRVRKRPVFDQTAAARLVQPERLLALRLAAGVDRGERHVVEALRPPGPDVEDTPYLGGIEKMQIDPDHVLDAEIEQRHRIAIVVLHHEAAVGLHGVGAGALMEHDVDRPGKIPGLDPPPKFVLVEKIGDLASRDIPELVAALQIVHGEDSSFAARVQRAHEVRAYESCRAGDDEVHSLSLPVTLALSPPPVLSDSTPGQTARAPPDRRDCVRRKSPAS